VEGLTVSSAYLLIRQFLHRARWYSARHLRLTFILTGLVVFVAAGSLGTSGCQHIGPSAGVTNDVCLVCHNGQNAKDVTGFLTGPHKSFRCEYCHGSGYLHVRNGGRGGLFINNLNELSTVASRLLCKRCHETEVSGFEKSHHAEEHALSCVACHDVHAGATGAPSALNNDMCLRCHRRMGFDSDKAIEAHTFHPVDPAGTGASRCTACHLVPLERSIPAGGVIHHQHSLVTAPPLRSIEAIDAGVFPVPANSCAGIVGCHDGSVITAPVFDVDNRADDVLLQILFEVRYGSPAADPDEEIE